MALSRWISTLRRLAGCSLVAAALAGCGVVGGEDFESLPKASRAKFTSAHYPTKGDSDPHPGVARVHGLPVHGIDVSRYQSNIDWAAVRAAGTKFAFVKATEGGDYVDPTFRQNWEGAGAAGIPRAAYHFIYWCRPAAEQARWFIRHVPRNARDLPPVIDAEWVNNSRTCKRRVSKEDALAKVKIISDMLERHYGKVPIIYTDINFHRDVLEGEPLDNTFWLRSTAAEPHERYASRRWTLWQWTQTGTVPGIRGHVDRNAFYGSPSEWAAFVATGCDPRHTRLLTSGRCGDQGLMVARAAPPPLSTPAPPAAVLAAAATLPPPVAPAPPALVASAAPLPPASPVVEAYAADATGSVTITDLIAGLEDE